ncbi:MAG: LacI family DNA-binding transcriptional regulator [Ruminococcus sp.]|nr:LacI family DNA-binding transcriptional regulator [Ruminococcus sp.]
MKNKVNISKIAKDMGISVSTVSRALSGNGRVSQETKQKISNYLLEKQLVPNIREKRYTDISTNIIAVTIPEEEDFAHLPYFQHILMSVYDFFSIRGYQVLPIKISSKNISNLKTAVEEHVMDGVIISRRVETIDEIELLKEHGVPFVVIGSIEDPEIMQVEADNERASYDLTSALLHMGYYKMAVMCADQRHPINIKRYKGIMDAHIENYQILDREFVFYGTDFNDIAELAVEKILAANIDCILCMDDNICLNVLRILQKNKIPVPQKIRVASLHNSKLLDAWCPGITCVNYDVDRLGKEASRILYTFLTENRKLPRTIMGYEIQMKESTT